MTISGTEAKSVSEKKKKFISSAFNAGRRWTLHARASLAEAFDQTVTSYIQNSLHSGADSTKAEGCQNVAVQIVRMLSN